MVSKIVELPRREVAFARFSPRRPESHEDRRILFRWVDRYFSDHVDELVYCFDGLRFAVRRTSRDFELRFDLIRPYGQMELEAAGIQRKWVGSERLLVERFEGVRDAIAADVDAWLRRAVAAYEGVTGYRERTTRIQVLGPNPIAPVTEIQVLLP